jgi:hypothetical protein
MHEPATRPALALAAILLVSTPVAAQGHRGLLELGWGSLNPGDPFHATLSFRASLGWAFAGRNALMAEYTRQSGNRSEGADLGKFARQFLGLSWHHAFTDAFSDQEPQQQQYLFRLGAGLLLRGTFPSAVGHADLRNALFLDAGAQIRYPFTDQLAVAGTIEDALAFLPRQVVSSYCTSESTGTVFCYPKGSPTYFDLTIDGRVQQNFGLFVALQWRP